MICAMGAISVLGFIVWAQMGYFLCSKTHLIFIKAFDPQVIKSLHMLESTLEELLYLTIKRKCSFLYEYNQQVILCKSLIGTQHGSFYKLILHFKSYIHNRTSETKRENSVFIDWFIGFTEGDGCFAIDSTNRRLFFKIRQKEPQILFKIKKQLQMGIVFYSKDGYWTYSISSKFQIFTLIHLFNGNLQLHKTQTRFKEWVNAHNQWWPKQHITLKSHSQISHYTSNAWLSGFSDADGSFSIYLGPTHRLRLKWYIDQCDEFVLLTKIRNFLNAGHLENKKCKTNSNCHRLLIDTFRGITPIINYFSHFPPKTNQLRVRFIRVRKLLPYELDGTFKNHLGRIKNLIRLNKRLNISSIKTD